MKVIWQTNAKNGKSQVSSYIYRHFGIKRLRQFKQEVESSVKMVMLHPNIGIIDPLFSERPVAYRSIIINGLSKMVYRVDDENDVVYIVAFWDTRREPKNQANRVK